MAATKTERVEIIIIAVILLFRTPLSFDSLDRDLSSPRIELYDFLAVLCQVFIAMQGNHPIFFNLDHKESPIV